MFNTKPTNEVRAIAGKHSGNLVTCSPSAQPIYNVLEQKAKSGNHWARITVSGLQSLCAGRMHLNNVFIKPATNISYGNEEFFLILPGCKATVEKQSNGQFRVLHIQADMNYGTLQRDFDKPGLWEVKKQREWKVSDIKSGHINNKKNRVVAITDSRMADPKQVVDASFPFLSNAPVSGGAFTLSQDGFDMHHTPGSKMIGGMKNVRQANMVESDSALNESALLLAKTMYNARKVKGVRWISVQGGSGVLTQAMQILADQEVTLKDHAVQFCAPTTNVNKAVSLAQSLGLSKDRNYHSQRNMLDLNQSIGGGLLSGYIVPYHRLKNESDYDALRFIGDLYKGTNSIKAAVATTISIGAAVGISSGVSIPAVLGFITTTAGTAALIPKVTEAYGSKYHHKIKDRF
jgi:hypothetical protein